MEQYKVSIIVPVYNVEKYLEEAILSLMNQTYQNLEIVLVDDGSPDRSGQICDELAAKDKRVKAIHKPNGGVISAWSRGVLESTGDYLAFMDSDDWVDLNMVEEMATYLTGKQEIISSDYVLERDDGSREFVYQRMQPGEYDKEALIEKLYPCLFGEEIRLISFSKCMKLIARKLVTDNLHFCDERVGMGDDTLIVAPALLDCERLVVMEKKPYYHYRFLRSSLVHRYDKKLFQNMDWLKAAIEKIVKEKYPSEQTQQMLARSDMEYIQMLLLVLKNEVRGNRDYINSIRRICLNPEIRNIVQTRPVQMTQTSNKLLYAVLKHPNRCLILLLRLAMRVYDAR
ncbi:MAG: glycosyltransferase family 2 protein [Lachnospiraceae bacterium]|nr:glycosyltransferase family 2 protein [Lachnospiraceae bacterium]